MCLMYMSSKPSSFVFTYYLYMGVTCLIILQYISLHLYTFMYIYLWPTALQVQAFDDIGFEI